MYRMVFTQVLCRLTKGLCLWSVCCFCIACSGYRSFRVDVLEPGKISLKEGDQIGFLDRMVRNVKDTASLMSNCPGITPEELIQNFYIGLNSTITDGGQLDSVRPMSWKTMSYTNDYNLIGPLAKKDVKTICDALALSYLVVMEQYDYPPLGDSETGMSANRYFIRLYSAQTAAPIDTTVFCNKFLFLLQEDYDLADFLTSGAWQQGADYAVKIAPHWTTVKRRVYNRQKTLGVGDVFFQRGDIQKAQNIWEAATKVSSRTAVKAYINLAWLYENTGDFEKSHAFLQQAADIAAHHKISGADKLYLEEYLKIIKKRIENQSLLGF